MKKAIALVMAAAMIIMICGCAKKAVQAPTAQEGAPEKEVVADGEKPSETVERVPDADIKQAERVPDQVAKAEAPAQGSKETKVKIAESKAPEAKPAETKAAETKAAETKAAAQEGDLVSKDYAPYAGKYTRTEDGSTFTLTKDGKVDISIVRLTQMDGQAQGISKGIIMIKAKDANDGEMGLEFLTETNELVVTDSKWSLLPNGETFKFDKKE